MSYEDPGDDERRAMESMGEVKTWKMWVSLLFPVFGIGLVCWFLMTRN
jgi:hypothetical protein